MWCDYKTTTDARNKFGLCRATVKKKEIKNGIIYWYVGALSGDLDIFVVQTRGQTSRNREKNAANNGKQCKFKEIATSYSRRLGLGRSR